jgi:hypothetical protein
MPNMRKSQWSNIRKRLLLLSNKELIAQIKDLYVISDENRRFLEARFAQGGDQVQSAMADYKQEIIYCFFGELLADRYCIESVECACNRLLVRQEF